MQVLIEKLTYSKLIAPATLYNLQKKYELLPAQTRNFLILREIYTIKGEHFWKEMVGNLDYNEYLHSIYWEIIKQYLHYSHRQCALCGLKKYLDVHHKTYEHLGYEILFLEDLEVICFRCHKKIHEKEGKTFEEREKLYRIWKFLYQKQRRNIQEL